jgi:hypothetical protein
LILPKLKNIFLFSQYQEYDHFRERARAAGYTVDPDYFKTKNTSSYKIAGGCVVFIVVGFVFQFLIGKMVSDHHQVTTLFLPFLIFLACLFV